MPAPVQLFSLTDLELALTGEKVRELLGDKGKPEPTSPRVQLIIDSATGFVLGFIQKAVKNASIDALWDSTWTERDKAELRRLAISAGVYYAHYYGQKADDVPETVITERDYVEKRASEIGEGLATLGNEPPAESTPLHSLSYTTSVGTYPEASARAKWGGF